LPHSTSNSSQSAGSPFSRSKSSRTITVARRTLLLCRLFHGRARGNAHDATLPRLF
jgi:hypothetical protein